jgi:density-regulated protein
VDISAEGEKPKQTKGNKAPKKKAVVIRVVDRTKRKRVTEISGLDMFDVDLKKASKQFSSKFACGSAVTRLATGLDEIHVAGDFANDVLILIRDSLGVPEKAISIAEPKKK